jgi:hypothetical protein
MVVGGLTQYHTRVQLEGMPADVERLTRRIQAFMNAGTDAPMVSLPTSQTGLDQGGKKHSTPLPAPKRSNS